MVSIAPSQVISGKPICDFMCVCIGKDNVKGVTLQPTKTANSSCRVVIADLLVCFDSDKATKPALTRLTISSLR